MSSICNHGPVATVLLCTVYGFGNEILLILNV